MKRRRCRFLILPPARFCAWHLEQAVDVVGDVLPALRDGALCLAQLRAWAEEFDAIGAGEAWPAVAFVDWLRAEVQLALGVA